MHLLLVENCVRAAVDYTLQRGDLARQTVYVISYKGFTAESQPNVFLLIKLNNELEPLH